MFRLSGAFAPVIRPAFHTGHAGKILLAHGQELVASRMASAKKAAEAMNLDNMADGPPIVEAPLRGQI